jgi:MFS family permease
MTTPAAPAVPQRSPLLTPPADRRPPRWRIATFRALRHRNYRLYFAGQFVSLIGSWVQTAALTWVAYALTGSNAFTGLVGAAQVVPTLALGIWGGSLADRLPRRRLIFATQALLLTLAVLLGGPVTLGWATPAWLLAVAVCIGVVNAFDTPARMAFVIDMVGREDLANAVALNSMLFNVARAVGPGVCGLLLPLLGAGPCFLLNGLSFVAILIALACMTLPAAPPRPAGHPGKSSLRQAMRQLAGDRGLVLLMVMAGAMAFFGWPMMTLLPDVSVKRLGAGNAGYSSMLSAVGFGALVGALLVASFGSGSRRKALLGGGVILTAAALLGLAAVRSLVPAVACCALFGCGLIQFFASGQATVQLGSADHHRGRILAVWLVVLSGAHPLGLLAAGRLADVYGVAFVIALQALGIAAAGLVVVLLKLARRE